MTAMDEETKTALLGSIQKWEAIVAGTGGDYGSKNCDLCKIFLDGNCIGCPVYAATGSSNCSKTPFIKWLKAFQPYERLPLNHNDSPTKVAAAQAELTFLKSLLPGA